MIPRFFRMRPCVLLAGLATCLALAAPGLAATADTIALKPCTLIGSSGYGTVEAECGSIRRPLDPDAPQGSTIDLFVAVVKALAPTVPSEAFTVINGGPGGSSVVLYADMTSAFRHVRRDRDIVIVDQRGTGLSAPLTCEALSDPDVETGEADVAEATRICLDQLPHDPRFFTTSVAVQDLEAVRVALGYDKLNLYGVSYGTRVALHYARRYPKAVRALIIDGVVPPDLALGPDVAPRAQHVLDTIFTRCAADTACAATFPDLKGDFARVAERLQKTGVRTDFTHPKTGEPHSLNVTYSHFALALRLMSYAPETAATIPLLISDAAVGNLVPIATTAVTVIDDLLEALNYGMHNAAVCTEDAPFLERSRIDMDALGDTYLGTAQLEQITEMCSLWPQGPIDSDFKAPLESDIPTLVLSGEFDPITPPEYAERVLKTLTNAVHVVAPGQGHGVVGRGCVPQLLGDFVASGSAETLETNCVDRMIPAAFFLSPLGPAP